MGLNKWVNISWCDHTYNFWRACAKVSEGCRNCWAENMMKRFGHTPDDWTVENINSNFAVYDEDPAQILGRVDPSWIFTPSASDPCLPWLPEDVRDRWMDGLRTHPEHCFQVLTKWGAEDRGLELPSMPENVILGVSCESPRRQYRIEWLREQEAATKFVSFEPLVEPIGEVDLSGIDWIIVGGESEPDSNQRRDMDPEWAVELYHAAREQDVAFLFKQHSAAHAEAERRLEVFPTVQREYNEFPEVPGDLPPAPVEYMEDDE